MTTTFETSVKISFEFSMSELNDLFSALNSAEFAIIQKRDNIPITHVDRRYYESVSKTLKDFVANFNPAKFIND